MVFVSQIRVALLGGALFCVFPSASWLAAQSPDQPMTRMRPIGAPSAVDQYRPRTQGGEGRVRQIAYQSPVRQTVMLQQGQLSSPPLPMNPSAPITAPAPSTVMPMPANQAGTVLPANPTLPTQSIVVGSDLQPMAQPQLGNGFATIDNCVLVSPPSDYSAASGCGCGTVVPQSYEVPQPTAAPVTYSPAPAEVAVPVVVPATTPSNATLGAPMRSMVTFGQERNPVQLGQGLVGQPVAYVPGQPFRNWIRYFSP